MTNEPEMTISARIDGDLARWFEEYRWTQRKLISDIVRDAVIEYRERHAPEQPPIVTEIRAPEVTP
jgi:hypothetical protein